MTLGYERAYDGVIAGSPGMAAQVQAKIEAMERAQQAPQPAAESGTVGVPAAFVNAVIDALRPLGVTDIEMPATPFRVWSAIQRARAATPATPPPDQPSTT